MYETYDEYLYALSKGEDEVAWVEYEREDSL